MANPFHWQYQPYAEPVEIKVAGPDAWMQPLSEPNRRNPLAAIVLAAQIGWFGSPPIFPPPPTDAPWFQALSEPVRIKLGLRPSDQQFIAFYDIQPFIPVFDPFVETASERAFRKKQEKRFRAEQERRFREELEQRNQRRLTIAEAVIGPLVPLEWTGVPVMVSTPQTEELTHQVLAAKHQVRVQQILDEEDDLAELLKDS